MESGQTKRFCTHKKKKKKEKNSILHTCTNEVTKIFKKTSVDERVAINITSTGWAGGTDFQTSLIPLEKVEIWEMTSKQGTYFFW